MERPFDLEYNEYGEYVFIIKDGVLYDSFVTAETNGGMNCFVIPDGVEELADFCVNFLMYSGYDRFLSKIVIPKSVKKIHPRAFLNSGEIGTFEVDPENPHFKVDGKFLLSKDGKRLVCFAFDGYEEDIAVPDGVEVIEETVFYNSAPDLLVFPESVKEIATQYHDLNCGESYDAEDLGTVVIKNKDVVFTGGVEEMLQFAKCIKAPAGSAAIEYAKEKGIRYEEI